MSLSSAIPTLPGVPTIRGQRLTAISAYLSRQSRYADWRPALPYLWQTDDTSTPVTAAGQTVGRSAAQVASAADMLWTQSTGAARPAWQTTYLDGDGGDYMDGSGSAPGLLRAASQACVITRLRVDAIGAAQRFIAFAAGTTGQPRLMIGVDTTGRLAVQVRRADADTTTFAASAGAAFTAGADHSLIVTVDYAAGGSGAIKGYVDGSEVLSASLASTGAAADTDSGRSRRFANLAASAAEFHDGRQHRCIVAAGASAIPTAAERAAIFAELAA